LFDRLAAFNQRHKARAEEEQASSSEMLKDIIIQSVLEPRNGFLPQFKASIKTTCQDLIEDEAEKHTTDVAAKFTTLEEQLLERNDSLQEYIQDRETKLQVQIEAAAKRTENIEEKLLQRHDTL
jgi:hypothetical protein